MSDAKQTQDCFHCGLVVTANNTFNVEIKGESQVMCCPGCQAVAEAIVDSGNTRFYEMRDVKQATATELVPDFLKKTTVYDHPDIQKSFVVNKGDLSQASLILEGITCAACVWLNEQHIAKLSGVHEVHINYSNHRASVTWDNQLIKLSDILQAIVSIGYQAHPYSPERQQAVFESEKKTQIKRLGIAGLFGMQVMMIAIALYSGEFSGVEAEYKILLEKTSWLLASPILFYSAVPLYQSAWRDIKRFTVGMDVPVALGISIAYGASVYSIITGQGHVYFDSVAMFVFLLLGSRYFELLARKKGVETAEHLVTLQPATATRILNVAHPEDDEELIPVVELQIGDHVLVKAGEIVPADGLIVDGKSSLNESLLTGEFDPVNKLSGDRVVAGSINVESALVIEVTGIGANTVMAGILRLLDEAQQDKPPITLMADRAARYFVAGVLLIAIVVALYWSSVSPDLWLPITLSVLVVSCPCALSLATPAAISAASTHLLQLGLLVTRGRAIESLAKANLFAFDKTGTLTKGEPIVDVIHNLTNEDDSYILKLASSLESFSEHPIAKAINKLSDSKMILLTDVISTAGRGVCAQLNGQPVAIGSRYFIEEQFSLSLDETENNGTEVVLANAEQIMAVFNLKDEQREGASNLIDWLKSKKIKIALLTGDNASSAKIISDSLGIEDVFSSLSPKEKLEKLQTFQNDNNVVVMIGDGINDGPVLAAADISIAMGNASELLHSKSDMVLLNENLEQLYEGVKISKKTMQIIRQNIFWAIGYNLLALPLAVTGSLSPWMAALGMSLSSLLVVMNALRLSLRSK